MDGERGAVVPKGRDLSANADDLLHTRLEILGEVGVVLLVIGRRHQHVDVASQDLVFAVAEQAFRGWIERLDAAAFVDDDDAVYRRFDDRAPARGIAARR